MQKIKKIFGLTLFNPATLKLLMNLIFRRKLSSAEAADYWNRLKSSNNPFFDFIAQEMSGSLGLYYSEERARENHLYYIHSARLKAVKVLLPPAKRILDIGGANSPLYDMGYPYEFDYMCMLDLPIDERHKEFKKEWQRGKGKVEVRYSNMTDLSFFSDNSFDLIWMGQVIEHITQAEAKQTLKEVFRVLAKGGRLILDTPNRAMTILHVKSEGSDSFIHPDHKHEYTANELERLIQGEGFQISSRLGICELPLTKRTNSFHYKDFVLGATWTSDIENSYILYYDCVK